MMDEMKNESKFMAKAHLELIHLVGVTVLAYRHPTGLYKAYRYDLIEKLIHELKELQKKD